MIKKLIFRQTLKLLFNSTIIIVILYFVTSFIIHNFPFERLSKSINQNYQASNKSTETKLTSLPLTIRLYDTPIMIDDGVIFINFDGSETSSKTYQLTKTEYPKLFQNTERISVEPVSISNNSEYKFAVIASQNYSRGGFGINHFVIWDFDQNKVIYESPDEFNSWNSGYNFSKDGREIQISSFPYWFYSSVTNSSLPFLEFATFDPRTKMFVRSNNTHKSEFQSLLKEYDSAADKCFHYRFQMNIEYMISEYGGDVFCDDYLDPKNPSFNNDSFISLGQFQSIRDNINKIIKGENISMSADNKEKFEGQKGNKEVYFSEEDIPLVLENSQKEELFSKYPELLDYVKGNNVFVRDMVEYKTNKTPIVVFQSYPVGCGSCGTRSVDYLYDGKVYMIQMGHEIHHQIVNENDKDILRVTYGILDGAGNSEYLWSQETDYTWEQEKETFVKISSKKVPSPYSKFKNVN